jgi:hypothetical protein
MGEMIYQYKICLKEIGWGGMDWIHGARQGLVAAPVNTIMNLRDSRKAGKFLCHLSDHQLLKNSASWSENLLCAYIVVWNQR